MNRSILALLFFLSIAPASSETIPLEQFNGIYMLPVRINGLVTIPFILDTGASEIAIPADVFMTLRRTKTVNDSDFIGTGTFVTAEGSQHKSERFVLRELKVGDHVVKDVIANVVPTEGEPLLGQSFLSRLASWSVDNNSHVLHLGDGGSEQQQPCRNLSAPFAQFERFDWRNTPCDRYAELFQPTQFVSGEPLAVLSLMRRPGWNGMSDRTMI